MLGGFVATHSTAELHSILTTWPIRPRTSSPAAAQALERNALEIPGSEGTFLRLEDFHKFVFESSWFRADGQILAANGGCWVGLGAVGCFANTNSTCNMHTGVLKEYRGRKIALALKLLAICYSRACGAVLLRNGNDSQNAPILAINRSWGTRQGQGGIGV